MDGSNLDSELFGMPIDGASPTRERQANCVIAPESSCQKHWKQEDDRNLPCAQ
jgi:hypothetical protein